MLVIAQRPLLRYWCGDLRSGECNDCCPCIPKMISILVTVYLYNYTNTNNNTFIDEKDADFVFQGVNLLAWKSCTSILERDFQLSLSDVLAAIEWVHPPR